MLSGPDPSRRATPLLLLDVDGTVRRGVDDGWRWVRGPDDVNVWPEAAALVARWRRPAHGGRALAVSNQGGVALGYASEEGVVAAFNETDTQLRDLSGDDACFDSLQFCMHAPDGSCWCRKPRGGLVFQGVLELERTYPEWYPPAWVLFVGDRPEDEECARRLDVEFRWAADWRATADRIATQGET